MPGFGYSPSATPAAAPTATSGLAAPAVEQHANPKVAELQTMFPTVETSVIEIILESVGGSQDRAIEQLLSITDENFRVEPASTGRREAESQVDLDEAFARSLALQDQERMQQHSQPQQQQPGYLPYQPRVKRTQNNNEQRQYDQHGRPAGLDERYQDRPDGQPQGQPGMLQMEKKLEEFAEVGKQTFNSFLSKAKAKYAEYQASQAQGQGSSAYGQGQSHGAPGQGQGQGQKYGYGQEGRNQAQMYGEESAAGWTRANTPGGGRGGAAWGRDQTNSRSTSFSSESTFSRDARDAEENQAQAQSKPAIRQSAGRWNPSDTYVDSTPPAPATGTAKMDIAGRRSPGSGGVAGSPGAKIDPSKLGFLPKKKVDLLSTSPGASTTNLNNANPTGSSTNLGAAGSGRNSLDAGEGHANVNVNASADPNPGLRTASADIIAKIPPTPPAHKGRFGDDDDDDLEYTK